MRYLGLSDQDRREMLAEIGVSNVDELFDAVNSELLLKEPIAGLPNHQGEIEIEAKMAKLAAKNRAAGDGAFFLGVGDYRHHVPASVDHIVQRAEFLTSYTPYQPEISQGTLAVIFQFQSIIAKLTGMEVANASMYDGATALAEACLMAIRVKRNRKKISFFGKVNDDYLKVKKLFLDLASAELVDYGNIDEETAAVVVQYPDFEGNIVDLAAIRQRCDEVGALMIVVVSEIVALGLIAAPGMADIVVGEASSLGVTLNFGGPLLGFFACKKAYVRQMPGRLCGVTEDVDGKHGYVLTLNAREQHIRREKATSNICSNQGLCATAFTIHASLLGENGMKKLALINHKKACEFVDLLRENGVKVLNDTFFNEFTVEFDEDAKSVNQKLLEKGVIGGYAVGNKMILAVTELTSRQDMEDFVEAL